MQEENIEKLDRVSLLYGQIVNNGARLTGQEAVDFYKALDELCHKYLESRQMEHKLPYQGVN